MKKVSWVLLFSMLFVIISPFANTTSASSNSLNLTDDYIVDYADYADIYIDEWDDKAFKTSENETIKKGIGLMEKNNGCNSILKIISILHSRQMFH
ncbi:hypothetical protein [Cytobacillus horneckiae]|uniref:hypothetical protein n=1 Tax=Cytobacillus horneckiae TaxID=549687 RepID=UPI00203D4998|nr:hypothetical protein [Cytobacillus horneckiae]MCM3179047.1 hypothetical protein [Cytobacillus horneckiae]